MSANPPEHRPYDEVSGAASTAPIGDDVREGSASLVLHAEELRAGVEHVPTKRVRLRKYVVEEQVNIPMTLRHEVVEMIEEPLTGADAATVAGPLPVGQEPSVVEMIVHREEPRIGVEVVATERIRLTRHVVVESVPVTQELAREEAQVIHDERTGVADDIERRR